MTALHNLNRSTSPARSTGHRTQQLQGLNSVVQRWLGPFKGYGSGF
ncbi:hypothetical protein RSAG8_09467, partial [Rhizoctonia solani AG-8 WAC10335]